MLIFDLLARRGDNKWFSAEGLGTRLPLGTLTCLKPMTIWPKILSLKSIWKIYRKIYRFMNYIYIIYRWLYVQDCSWFSVIPLEEHNFMLNKGEFRDAVSLRYRKILFGQSSICPCGQIYDTKHTLNCKRSGFVIIRCNTIQNVEASLLWKVCTDVETEPQLQPLNGEQIIFLIGNEARPHIRARGVSHAGQKAYFDVRITNTNSNFQSYLTWKQIFAKHEKEKKDNTTVVSLISSTVFTPMVFSINGGAGAECLSFHRHIAERIATKTEGRYEKIMSLIRIKLSFIIIRSALMCIRGCRSHGKKDSWELRRHWNRVCCFSLYTLFLYKELVYKQLELDFQKVKQLLGLKHVP